MKLKERASQGHCGDEVPGDPTEGIGAAEEAKLRVGPMSGASMGFKKFSLLNNPETMVRSEGYL